VAIRLACGVLLSLAALPAFAIDSIVFEADEIAARGTKVSKPSVTLDLRSSPAVRVRVDQVSELRDVTLNCTDLVIKEPLFACRAAHVTIPHSRIGPLDVRASAAYHTDSSLLTFGVNKLAIAGGTAHLDGTFRDGQWTVKSAANGLQPTALRALIKPWLAIPDALTIEGGLNAQLEANGSGKNIRFASALKTQNFGFSNEEGTIAAEKVAVSMDAKGSMIGDAVAIDARVVSTTGQALAGPVLLDFGVNPLTLRLKGEMTARAVRIDSLSIDQTRLLKARASGGANRYRQPRVARRLYELRAAHSRDQRLRSTQNLGAR
jgi:hypothetical protein